MTFPRSHPDVEGPAEQRRTEAEPTGQLPLFRPQEQQADAPGRQQGDAVNPQQVEDENDDPVGDRQSIG